MAIIKVRSLVQRTSHQSVLKISYRIETRGTEANLCSNGQNLSRVIVSSGLERYLMQNEYHLDTFTKKA